MPLFFVSQVPEVWSDVRDLIMKEPLWWYYYPTLIVLGPLCTVSLIQNKVLSKLYRFAKNRIYYDLVFKIRQYEIWWQQAYILRKTHISLIIASYILSFEFQHQVWPSECTQNRYFSMKSKIITRLSTLFRFSVLHLGCFQVLSSRMKSIPVSW